ncbi:hypothetical protein HAX54_027220 [Datura stramonium]|uniref:Uncharacterized protein n=1 Tax=Datura stramonium TaxID=4076 RepID=A0ABS8S8J2_DATST|nr:hypothetical protein [Datura stramonium]
MVSIPESICNCTELSLVGFNNNNSQANYHLEIGNLAKLQLLRSLSKQFGWFYSYSIGMLTALQTLDLSETSYLDLYHQKLATLSSAYPPPNRLTGEIPSTLTNLTNLTYLSLSFNLLTGSLPTEFGLHYNLKNLTASNNLLEGSIPSSITNCSHLLVLTVAYNRITGKIPNGLGQLDNSFKV